VAALRLGLSVILRLFAPTLPYITEEIWSWAFAEEASPDAEGAARSIHAAAWPGAADFGGIEGPTHPESFDTATAALAAINKAKADAEVSMGRDVESLTLAASAETLAIFEGVAEDVMAAARVRSPAWISKDGVDPGVFEVETIAFAPRPEKSQDA
jgi:valyl-tRNA synthetase